MAVTIPGMGANDEIQTVRFYYDTLTLNSAGKFTGMTTAVEVAVVAQYMKQDTRLLVAHHTITLALPKKAL